MFSAKTHITEPTVSTQHAIYPTSKLKGYVTLLITCKGISTLCYFLSYEVLQVVHLVYFLFVTKSISSIILVLIQKPFSSGKRLCKQQWGRVLQHALVATFLSLVQLFGLCLCGPLRTVLLVEQKEAVVVSAVAALFAGIGGNSKLRGAVCFLVGVLSLILLDHDETLPLATEHPEGELHRGVGHLFYYSMSWLGLVDHKAGVLLLVLSLCLQAAFGASARRLAVDVGGAKRLHALTVMVSSLLLAPWAFFLRLTQTSLRFQWSDHSLSFVAVAVWMFVADYYVDAICTAKMEAGCSARISSLASFSFALVAGCLPLLHVGRRHNLSLGVVLSWVAFSLATVILTSGAAKKSGRGTFVGYSAAGLPLYSLNGDSSQHGNSRSLFLMVGGGLRQILEESDSRKIFYFLCLNMIFTAVEMTYGIWTNSLGLISDGFHMLFDCSALIMGLCASLLARKKPTKTFPFGYGRIEVLSGFVNGLFLVVVAAVVFKEALARLLDPPKILTTRLLTVSVAGLMVNLLGILVFRHAHHHHHSHVSSGNANLQGVFLHIVADTLGSVGVIVSSLLIEHLGLDVADPVCSLFISLLILCSVVPLLDHTARVLLNGTPRDLKRSPAAALNEVMQIRGVLSYRDPRFWQHAPEVVAGCIHVQVAPSASEQKTTNRVSAIFRDLGFAHFSVQVEKESFFQHMSGLGNDLHNMLRSARGNSTVKTV